jgi:hypothetical protein
MHARTALFGLPVAPLMKCSVAGSVVVIVQSGDDESRSS